MISPRLLCRFLTVWSFFTSSGAAAVAPIVTNSTLHGYSVAQTQSIPRHVLGRAIPPNFKLRLLCLGDSITVGVGDGYPILKNLNNGYRLDLLNLLQGVGIDVEFIGTQISGTDNSQPRNEGYGGQTIQMILTNIQQNAILNQQPNIVLIHAGTNDNDLPQTSDDPSTLYSNAPTRLGNLIDYVLCQDPNAVVLVAKLIQNKYHQEQTNAFNAAVPGVVEQRYMLGYKVRTIDMSMIGGDELSDVLHPTAAGYQDMANRWFSAILGIPDSWWTMASTSQVSGSTVETCKRGSINFTPAIHGNLVAGGYHVPGDTPDPLALPESQGNTFSPGWTDDGVIALGCGWAGSGVIFADLNGDGRPDYIWANYTQGSEGSIHAWLNGGKDVWNVINNGEAIAWGQAGTSYVEFADLDGDKKSEYILVVGGRFKIWQNGGPNGQQWTWNPLPNAENELNYIFANSVPFHWWADIDGDGRADLIVEGNYGVLDIYFNNGGDGNGGFKWTQCKALGVATGILDFVDIDGDGKADYVSEDPEGGLTGWLNDFQGGCNLKWIPISGRTPKSLAWGTGASASHVRLADFTGDGKADYLTVDDAGGAVHMHINTGSTHSPDSTGLGGWASAVRLSDMDGDGRDDYITVTANPGGIAAFLNKGQGSGDFWLWEELNQGNLIALGFTGADRAEIQLADMNADGRDDYLVVDPLTGALHCYLNYGQSSTQIWNWNIMGEVAFGVGGVGAGVRIADFDGDGRADYIYLDDSGAAKVWLNQGQGDILTDWNVINGGSLAALGVGAHRDDVHFADIDGDGKADYCWLHPDTGDLQVWYNGFDGKTIGWTPGGVIMPGQGYPGANIRLARIGTSGRADYVALGQDNGGFKMWINECSDVLATAHRTINSGCGVPPLPRPTAPGLVVGTAPVILSTATGDQTVIQGSGSARVTLPPALSTPFTLTAPDGETITYIPGGNTVPTTSTDPFGQTVIQGSGGAQTTVPPGITQPVTLTLTGGEIVTFNQPSGPSLPTGSNVATTTSSNLVGIIFPITTPVPAPTTTGTRTVIPCKLWFFFICIDWGDFHIDGWEFEFPQGIRPPGPPPPIRFPPDLFPGIIINTIGPLPPWPEITIGPDRLPTYTPSQSPTSCQTKTGQICLTSTSYAVSGTSTTSSTVRETCATIYGCDATDSATATTTASTTNPACPLTLPYKPYLTAAGQIAPLLGDGGLGGTMIYGSMGQFTPKPFSSPPASTSTPQSTPVATSSGPTASPSSQIAYCPSKHAIDCPPCEPGFDRECFSANGGPFVCACDRVETDRLSVGQYIRQALNG